MTDTSHEIGVVSTLTFARLTAPVLAQMKTGPTWRSLRHIAGRVAEGQTGGNWEPGSTAGACHISINPSGSLQTVVRLRSANRVIGPNEMSGRNLDICNTDLPETLRLGLVGSPIRALVDPAQVNDVVLGTEIIRRVERQNWGIRVVLDLPYLMPTIEDLREIMAADTGD